MFAFWDRRDLGSEHYDNHTSHFTQQRSPESRILPGRPSRPSSGLQGDPNTHDPFPGGDSVLAEQMGNARASNQLQACGNEWNK